MLPSWLKLIMSQTPLWGRADGLPCCWGGSVLSQSPIHESSGAPAPPGHICWGGPKIIVTLLKI